MAGATASRCSRTLVLISLSKHIASGVGTNGPRHDVRGYVASHARRVDVLIDSLADHFTCRCAK